METFSVDRVGVDPYAKLFIDDNNNKNKNDTSLKKESEMLEKLREKLKKDHKSIKEFVKEYLPDMTYSAVSLQINEFNTLQDEVKEAIQKYLAEK